MWMEKTWLQISLLQRRRIWCALCVGVPLVLPQICLLLRLGSKQFVPHGTVLAGALMFPPTKMIRLWKEKWICSSLLSGPHGMHHSGLSIFAGDRWSMNLSRVMHMVLILQFVSSTSKLGKCLSLSSKHLCDLRVIPGWAGGGSFRAKVAYISVTSRSERIEFAYGIASLYFRIFHSGLAYPGCSCPTISDCCDCHLSS